MNNRLLYKYVSCGTWYFIPMFHVEQLIFYWGYNMKVFLEGNVLEVEVKEYEFQGKKGISNKVVVYSEGKLYKIKIKSSDIDIYKNLVGEVIRLECNLFVDGKSSLSVA